MEQHSRAEPGGPQHGLNHTQPCYRSRMVALIDHTRELASKARRRGCKRGLERQWARAPARCTDIRCQRPARERSPERRTHSPGHRAERAPQTSYPPSPSPPRWCRSSPTPEHRRARRWWTARRAYGWDGRTRAGAGLRDRGAVESTREPDSGAWCAASSPRGGRRTAAALPEWSAHPVGRQRIAQTRAPSPDATSAERRARCRRIGSSSGPAGSPARPRRPRRPGLSPASPAQPRPTKSASETAKRADGRTEGTGSEAQLQDWGAVETIHLGDSYAWCAGTSRRGDPPAEGGPGGVCGGELAEPERRLRGLKGICTGGARNQRHDCRAAGLLGLIKAGGAVCVRRKRTRRRLRRWRAHLRLRAEKSIPGAATRPQNSRVFLRSS